MKNKRILYLTLKKVWFDQIAHGVKKVEYREQKGYWLSRLYNRHLYIRRFDEIHFRNGYHKNSPFMRVKWEDTYQTKQDNKDVFAILLGKILEIKNYGKRISKEHCR